MNVLKACLHSHVLLRFRILFLVLVERSWNQVYQNCQQSPIM